MSELTKQQLAVENSNSFPNNNTGFITPTLLRTFNGNIIDSMVDEITYNAESASWTSDILALEQFSSSLDANFASTAELNASSSTLQNNINTKLSTASYQTDSASFNSRINAITGSSVDTSSLVTTSSFNSYTASNDSKVNSLINATASYAISSSVAQITSASQGQINSLISATGSYITSAQTSSMTVLSASFAQTASFLLGTVASASFATSASYAATSSFADYADDVYVLAKNSSGAQINAGRIVRIVGAVGDNPLIGTASWEDDSVSANTLGWVESNIPNDSFGRVITQGVVLGINTDPTLGYAAGQLLYLSSSGQFTNQIPPAPFHEVRLGQVLRAQQNNGSIFAQIQNGYEISELHDVTIVSASQGDLLAYNSASGQWENSSSIQLGLVTTSSFNNYTSSASNAVSGAINTATQSLSSSIAVTTNGLDLEINKKLNSSSFNSYTQSNDTKVNDLIAATGSYAISSSVATITGNSLVTASISGDTITFTKGNGSTFPIVVPTTSGSVPSGTVSSSVQITEFGFATTSSVSESVSALNAATSSYITSAQTSSMNVASASFATTASFALNATTDTSSFATTGSNTFVGNQIVSSSIIGVGDLYIQPTNQSTNFSNISASVSGNIIFGAIFGDSQPQQTGSLVISGSNNLVLIGKPTATSGYYSYLNGAQNIYGLRTLLSTGSVLRPFMYNNILQRTVTLNFITSSNATQPGFSNNLLYGNGTTTFNHQSGSLNFQGNLVGGNNILTSTQNVTPTTTRVGITGNILNGTQTFLHQSSSITLDRNIFNGLTAPAIRNDFSNSFNDGLTVSRNIVNGSNVFIYNSGSTTSGSGVGNRSITDNLFGGNNIIISSSHIATNNGNANLVGAIVHGYNLNVSASSTTSTGGNVFVGRNNDTSSNLASTSDIIFAVGTGTSTSARKTGLWIDTGSLTTINGGLYVTQSQVTLTNSGSSPSTLALAVRSGSVEVTSPQGNGYFYTNLPVTSSALRINGNGIISDLFVSGVFSGNSTLNVAGNSYFTGSVFTSASVNGVVNPLSISSQTASLDFSKGNFFTIQLVSGSVTHINPTNIAAGQTINIRVNTTGSGTVTFASSIKQVSGSSYIPTTTTGVDVITMVTFDTSDIYLANVKNLI